MFVHLGNGISAKSRNIIGIFDIEKTSLGNDTRQYLKRATNAKNVINVSLEMPKSFIVCADKENVEKVYISQISSSALKKRLENGIV